jgi:hypothetical protein
VTEKIDVIIAADTLRTAIKAQLRRGTRRETVSALIKAYAAPEAQTVRLIRQRADALYGGGSSAPRQGADDRAEHPFVFFVRYLGEVAHQLQEQSTTNSGRMSMV